MTPDIEHIVNDYLGRLETAATELPAAQRQQLMAQITEHLNEARAAMPEETEAGVRALLDQIGLPEDIVAAALADSGDSARGALLVADPTSSWRHRRSLVTGLVGLAVVLAAGIILAVSLSGGTGGHSPRQSSVTTTMTVPHSSGAVTVPNVLGEPASRAIDTLQSAGLTIGPAHDAVSDPSTPLGSVVSQQPSPGASLRAGSVVKLWIASGTTTTTMTTVPATTVALS